MKTREFLTREPSFDPLRGAIARIEALKAKRATLATPIERILFDNDPRNGTTAERIVAMTEADRADT